MDIPDRKAEIKAELKTPLKKYKSWLVTDEGAAVLAPLYIKLGRWEVNNVLTGLFNWLHKYEKSPRATKKTAWKRFTLNNMPTRRSSGATTRSEQPADEFNNDEGESKF